MILITDVHGCYRTMMTLLAKCPENDPIYILGDMMDRGPRSKEVIYECMTNPRIYCCKGNHDHAMVDHCTRRHEYYERGSWLHKGMGGMETLRSFDNYIPSNVIGFVDQLPLGYRPKEFPELYLSHTGHIPTDDVDLISALWCKDPLFPKDGLFRVFGHTPQMEPVIEKTYANIDTGCVFQQENKGSGNLTALVYPSMEIIQQPYCE